MSWLDDKTDNAENRAKWKFQREANANRVNESTKMGALRRRVNADEELAHEMNLRAKDVARDAIPPALRGRDILSGGLTNALLGLAALAAVASQNPDVNEKIRNGVSNLASEISADLHAAKRAFTADPFAAAFDNE